MMHTDANVYYPILNRLRKDVIFREAFFDDPRKALEHRNISLFEEDIKRLVNYEWVKVGKEEVRFDEKLLLCCSVGF